MNVARHLLERLGAHGARPVYGAAGGDVSADAFAARVRERARALGPGIRPDDPILIFNLRKMDFWVDVLAVWLVGGVVVPVPISTDEASLATILRVAKPRAHLGDPRHHASALAGVPRLDEHANAPEPVEAEGGARLASVNFTSGSTGEPKGVLLTHDMLLGNCLATLEAIGVAPGDRVIVPIPFNFISAVSHLLVCMTAGACAIATEDKLMQKDLAELVRATRANALGGAPLHLRWVSELCEADAAAGERTFSMRWLMASGDHLGVDVIERLERFSPETRVIVVYGLTEVAGRCCVLDRAKVRAEHPGDPHALIDAVGTPIRGLEAKVVDDDGAEVPRGEIGEVVLSGPYVFLGYLDRPEATADVLRNGRFHTRDMGKMDARGNVYVVGRKDDVFKSSGLKVATVPIADALMDIGIFADVAVRPKEHVVAGHVPECLYVLREGQTFQKGDVIAELRKRLPLHWIPQQFTEVAAIPRTGSGKISRRELKNLETGQG